VLKEVVMSTELEAVARRLLEAFVARDRAGWRAELTDDCIYHEFGTGREAQGADPVTDLVFGWFDAFPDLRGGIDNLVAGDGYVVIETLWQGTHEGPLALPDGIVIPATDTRWTNPAVSSIASSTANAPRSTTTSTWHDCSRRSPPSPRSPLLRPSRARVLRCERPAPPRGSAA
jgi:hypothetical protein